MTEQQHNLLIERRILADDSALIGPGPSLAGTEFGLLTRPGGLEPVGERLPAVRQAPLMAVHVLLSVVPVKSSETTTCAKANAGTIAAHVATAPKRPSFQV